MRFFSLHRSISLALLALTLLLPASPVFAADDNAGPQALWASAMPNTSGQTQTLSKYKGHPLVVNFWASWCGPCVQEMPELSAMQTQYLSKGIQFVGIGIDSPDNIKEFTKKVKVTYPIYVAGFGGADLARAFGNSAGGLPFTVVIDAQGKVRYAKLGRIDAAELRQALSAL